MRSSTRYKCFMSTQGRACGANSSIYSSRTSPTGIEPMKEFKVDPKSFMKRLFVTGMLIVSMTALAWTTEQSRPDSGFDAQQRREIESIIRQYILDHPEVIGAAIQKLQAQEQQAEEQRSREAASAVKPIGPQDHFLGSAAAPIKVIEFSDFECPYCKRFHMTMKQLMDEYG